MPHADRYEDTDKAALSKALRDMSSDVALDLYVAISNARDLCPERMYRKDNVIVMCTWDRRVRITVEVLEA